MSSMFSFGHSDQAVMHSEFMGFVLDDDSLSSLRAWAERQGYPSASVQQGGPDIFAQMLESSSPPKMAMVDIDGHADAGAIISRIVNLCGGDCRVIAVGSINDVTLYRRIINAGAVDYLVKPLTSDLLNQALAVALRVPINKKPGATEARIIAFIGVRGGVGASTIALNVGWLMAHELNLNIALLDLDLQFGTSSLALDLAPGHGLSDIVSSPNRVDGLMIASSTVQESDRLSILGAEEAVDEVVPIDGGAITALFKEMSANFDAIVVDLPRHMLGAHKRLAMAAHEIVIISDLTLAGIRDALRIKTALIGLSCTARLTFVAARTNAAGAGHVSRAVFEKGIQNPIDAVIPEDAESVSVASNSGKSLPSSAPRSPITKALRELTIRLAALDPELEPKKKTSSLLDKIMRAATSKNKGKPKGVA